MMDRVFNYIKNIEKHWKMDGVGEHTHRPYIITLLELLLPNIIVINEPARIECGAPDILLRSNNATNAPIGYIETKDIGDTDLDGVTKDNREQFERYKLALPNIVFTDYLDFHFYENGQLTTTIRIADIRGDKIVPANNNTLKEFIARMEHFGAVQPELITSPQLLAKLMAGKAQLLARSILATIVADTDAKGTASRQMRTIRRFLIPDLIESTFADIYAQTITYGLFAARIHDNSPENFSREEAARLLPKTNPLMRKMFLDIDQELDKSLEWIVDDLVALFASTNVDAIMHAYSNDGSYDDPVLHFYEDFLTKYDTKVRRKRGVYYTPTSVVRFIVRAVDTILVRDFGLQGGLADNSQIIAKDEKMAHRLQILDPSVGTGAFLAETIRQVHDKFVVGNQEGQWPSYAATELLPRLNGFEILMAPYAIAHLKLDILLARTGCIPSTEQRLRVFLTNALENLPIPETADLLAAALADEAEEANAVKRDYRVMVVVGNPPYSGESQNKGKAIMRLMEDYKMEPGGKEKLRERNPKWINDDYVKFLRLAQDYIDRTGEGIIGFINPHGFLDNPTFRGVRWKLLDSFDKIYVLNLHGNAKKREVAPDGSKDENVFDIMQGVSINIFVKRKKSDCVSAPCSVYYVDVYGKREDKYAFLETKGLDDIKWQKVQPTPPLYFFTPKESSGEEYYLNGFSLVDLFEQNSMGVTTGNDAVLVRMKKADLLSGVTATYHESVDEALVRKFSYRPFDSQYIYYKPTLLARARDKFMSKLQDDTVSLSAIRICSRDDDCPVFVTEGIVDKTILSSKDNANIFPLYLYRETFGQIEKNSKSQSRNRETNRGGGGERPLSRGHLLLYLRNPAYTRIPKEI